MKFMKNSGLTTQLMLLFLVVFIVGRPAFVFSQDSLSVLDILKGARSVIIKKILGNGTNSGLVFVLENQKNYTIKVSFPYGLMVSSKRMATQRMVTWREQTFLVEPSIELEAKLETLCLDALKNPPMAEDSSYLYIDHLIEDPDILELFDTIKKLERIISDNVISVKDSRFEMKPIDNDEIIKLATYCQFSEIDSSRYQAKISPMVIQCALWQITDRISADDLFKIYHVDSVAEREDIKKVAEGAKILLYFNGMGTTVNFEK